MPVSSIGKENSATANIYHAIAETHFVQDEDTEALRWFEKVLSIDEKRYKGRPNAETATTLNTMGIIYLKLGEPLKSMELLQKAFTMRKIVLPEKHPDTVHTSKLIEKVNGIIRMI